MHFVITPGERHETVAFETLLKGGKVKRLLRGRPKHRSQYLVGDKAYSSGEIRQELRRSGSTPVIPKRSNQKRRRRFNRGLYRERNRVERLINRLKQYRRIATRYEKKRTVPNNLRPFVRRSSEFLKPFSLIYLEVLRCAVGSAEIG